MKNDELAIEDEEEDEDSKNIVLPPPKMSINLRSSDPMEICVTKTCLEVLNNLAKVRLRMETQHRLTDRHAAQTDNVITLKHDVSGFF